MAAVGTDADPLFRRVEQVVDGETVALHSNSIDDGVRTDATGHFHGTIPVPRRRTRKVNRLRDNYTPLWASVGDPGWRLARPGIAAAYAIHAGSGDDSDEPAAITLMRDMVGIFEERNVEAAAVRGAGGGSRRHGGRLC